MKYAVMVFLVFPCLYALSFARYNWKKGNKPGAVGALLVGLVSLALPGVLMFTR